jgi:hypothetical protein
MIWEHPIDWLSIHVHTSKPYTPALYAIISKLACNSLTILIPTLDPIDITRRSSKVFVAYDRSVELLCKPSLAICVGLWSACFV